MRNKALAAVLTVGLIGTAGAVWSSANEASGAAVGKYVQTAKISLQDGLKAAESEGQPISGKFELTDGKLQLAVYTAKDGKFSEVLVDQSTGKIAKSEAITDGTGLAVAEKQLEAYGKSKTSLKSAVSRAEQAYPGYHAVSVTPTLNHGLPIAVVSLAQGTQVRSVAEPLT
jgi:hypothetical protein